MKSNHLKLLNSALTQSLKNNLRLTTSAAPKYIKVVKDEIIYKKINDLNSWYTRIIGLDEVKLYQDRVADLQEKLLAAQETRRNIGIQLTEIRKKSNELQDQIHKVKRQDDLQRFLDFMKEETEILKKEQEISRSFSECDRTEREIFTAFTNAVRDSHEKQRAQLEYTKYFGLILSLVGSFLTFCYSTLRKQDLKNFIEENIRSANGTSEPVLIQLQNNQHQLNNIIKHIQHDSPKIVNLIDRHHNEILRLLKPEEIHASGFVLHEVNHINEVFATKKIVLYSCGAVIGLIILRICWS